MEIPLEFTWHIRHEMALLLNGSEDAEAGNGRR